MKATTPTAPPIKTGGNNDPDWLIIVYAIASVSLIVAWAYILSK